LEFLNDLEKQKVEAQAEVRATQFIRPSRGGKPREEGKGTCAED
jgi:hypothetical protein